MAIIELDDLPDDVRNKIDDKVLQAMLDGLNAKALRVAPCLHPDNDPPPTPELLAESKLILLSAFQRFSDVGAGAITQLGAGSFQMSTDTRQRSGYNLWPSEITALQDLCKARESGGAFAIDTAPRRPAWHVDICAVNFGADYCSCGAVLAGFPLYETHGAP